MRRVLPLTLVPRPRPTVMPVEFLVQVTTTVPVPTLSAAALAPTGSYPPKPTAVVEIVQFVLTLAVTLRLLVEEPAEAVPANPAKVPAIARVRVSFLNILRSLFCRGL